jgi:hypothetical protein
MLPQALAMVCDLAQSKLGKIWKAQKPSPCYLTVKVADGRKVTQWGNPQYLQVFNVSGMLPYLLCRSVPSTNLHMFGCSGRRQAHHAAAWRSALRQRELLVHVLHQHAL